MSFKRFQILGEYEIGAAREVREILRPIQDVDQPTIEKSLLSGDIQNE